MIYENVALMMKENATWSMIIGKLFWSGRSKLAGILVWVFLTVSMVDIVTSRDYRILEWIGWTLLISALVLEFGARTREGRIRLLVFLGGAFLVLSAVALYIYSRSN